MFCISRRISHKHCQTTSRAVSWRFNTLNCPWQFLFPVSGQDLQDPHVFLWAFVPHVSSQFCSYPASEWQMVGESLYRIIWQHVTYGKLILTIEVCILMLAARMPRVFLRTSVCLGEAPKKEKQVGWKVNCTFGWPFPGLSKCVSVGLRNHKEIEWSGLLIWRCSSLHEFSKFMNLKGDDN